MSLSRKAVELPFADWPKTEFIENGSAARLKGRYEKAGSDLTAKLLGLLAVLLWFFLTPFSCVVVTDNYYGGDLENMPAETAGYLFMGTIGACIVIWLLLFLLVSRRNLNVIISRDYIAINGRRYAWLDEMQIGIEAHPKSARHHEWRDAVQVVLRYGEKRVVIADFPHYQRRKAEALMRRIQWIAQHIGDLSGESGEVIGAQTRDEFGPAPPIR